MDSVTAPPPAAVPAGSLAAEALADAGDGWLSLVEADWKLDPQRERYICARITVPRDVYVHEFLPVAPVGTHHSGLSVEPAGSGPDEVYDCGPDLSGHQIYGSGVGTKAYALPDGVAMPVRAGEQLVLNLHLYNTTDAELSGRSGVRARSVDEHSVQHLAESILAGPLSLTIPLGQSTQTGQCTIADTSTFFNVAPHMHRLGVHMKVVAQRQTAGEIVLFDDAYAFDSQQRYAIDPLMLTAGDVIHVECTYENTTTHMVSWGQSTNDEMCFAGLNRYPATSSGYLCTN
jgi:hypothetical protein